MRRVRSVVLGIAAAAAAVGVVATVRAANHVPTRAPFLPVDVPWTDVDPTMDGQATSFDEWKRARVVPDFFSVGRQTLAGWYWFERRTDWLATSVASGLEATVEGTTLFVAHDIVGSTDTANPLHWFQVQEDDDWNSFSFPTSRGVVKIWVFANGNVADDATWLDGAEGLGDSALAPEGAGADVIDDRGFIVRLDDDPATDRHWFPGDPEPGDPGWDPEAFYGCFGRATFGTSFQDTGLDTNPADDVPHEVYEFCCTDPVEPRTCKWYEWEYIKIDDQLVWFQVLKGEFWLHTWDPPYVPPPGQPVPSWRFKWLGPVVQQAAHPYQDANPSVATALTAAGTALNDVVVRMSEGDGLGAFSSEAKALKALAKARKKLRDPLVTRDWEMHVVAGGLDQSLEVFETTVLRPPPVMGAKPSDARIRQAAAAIRAAGVKLQALQRKGGNGSYAKVLALYRKAFKALRTN